MKEAPVSASFLAPTLSKGGAWYLLRAMPLSSSDIAQMNGGYQQMAMGQMQYAMQIGQYGYQQGQQNAGNPGDRIMGGMMNKGMAIGAPMAALGMGVMGMDPMSMGMRGAMAGYSGGGLMGAAAGGFAAAAVPMAATAAVSYGAHQMMEGAHQQQLINQTLRTNFNHIGQYGRGFQRQEMTQIGQQMRGMTHEYGAGGEMTTMNELTNLAGKMGQMGGGRGVTDVQEFSRKFKELVTTVKTVATELGTSLESAQNMLQGLKGSGVFSKGDQMSAFKLAKGASLGGNLAMEEVMGMGSMGSQVSRAIGGRGRAGFAAGVKTAGMIGGALETGVLSEEDIYNATGQTGAEGRQALGSSLMSINASFLRSSRGRRVVASMAGKDGSLDGESVDSYNASGGFGTDGTMGRAYKNLGKVGRANFIRNEGRLRGEALGADPLIGVRQTMSWLESRGIDMNSDLGRIALQRQMRAGGANVGEEQLDTLVKLVQRGDVMADNQKGRVAQDKTMQEIGNMNKTTGLAGMKTKLEHARETVQGKLQQAGAEFMNEGAEQIERLISSLSEQYVQTYSRSVDEAFRKGSGGSVSGKQKYKELTGRSSMMGDSSGSAEALRQGRFGGAVNPNTRDVGDTDRMAKAGYANTSAGDGDRADRMAFAASTRVDRSFLEMGGANRDAIRRAYANGDFEGGGDVRINNVNKFMHKAGLGDKDLQARLGSGGVTGNRDESNAVRAASLLKGAGIDDNGFASPGSREGLQGTLGHTTAERQELLGRGLVGAAERSNTSKAAGWLGDALGMGSRIAGKLGMGGESVGLLMAGRLASNIGNTASGAQRAAGGFLDSDKGRDAALGIMSRDKDRREAAYEENLEKMIEMRQDSGHWTDAQKGEFGARQSLMMAHDVGAAMDKEGMSLETAVAQVAESTGQTKERISEAYTAVRAGLQQKGSEEARKYQNAIKKEGRDALRGLTNRGAIEMDAEGNATLSGSVYNGAAAFDKSGKGGGRAREMLDAMVGAETAKAAGDDLGAMDQYAKAAGIQDNMTVAQKRALASELRGRKGGGAFAGDLERKASVEDRYNKTSSRYGEASGAAALLGVDMTAEDRTNLKGREAGQQAEYLLQKAGVSLDSEKGAGILKELQSAMGDKSLSSGQRSSRIAGLAGEVQKEGALNRDKEKNPLMDKMATGIDKMAAAMEKLSPTAIGDGVAGAMRSGIQQVEVVGGKT